jgi:hypothetical protein
MQQAAVGQGGEQKDRSRKRACQHETVKYKSYSDGADPLLLAKARLHPELLANPPQLHLLLCIHTYADMMLLLLLLLLPAVEAQSADSWLAEASLAR